MHYISDIIGESFKAWEKRSNILIPAPTGHGKTTFVLRQLLPYADSLEKNIIYICNRKILNDQISQEQDRIKEELGVSENYAHRFHIVTYQYCETCHQFPNFEFDSTEPNQISETSKKTHYKKASLPKITISADSVLYYIFDEAHYFLCDSLFNSSTNYWLGKDIFRADGIKIFLTATPEPLHLFASAQYRLKAVDDSIKSFHDAFGEKRSIQKEAATPHFLVDLNKSKTLPARDKARDIAEKCRNINPYYSEFFELEGNSSAPHFVMCPYEKPDYSWMSFWYFWEYSELTAKICKANINNKWIIFVNKEDDGIRLEERLNTISGDNGFAVFQSSKIIRSTVQGREMLRALSIEKKFPSPVLITTSVMDCGVSIHDPAVRHIVIAESQKTTFLQELGRKRRGRNETDVKVYIKGFHPKEINGISHLLDAKMRFLVNFALLNETNLKRHSAPNKWSDGNHEVPVLSAHSADTTIKDLLSSKNSALVYHVPDYNNRMEQSHFVSAGILSKLDEYRYSKTAFLYIILAMHDYQKALESYRKTGDDAFYVKHQLSWVGHPYQENHWVTYNQCLESLSTFLDNNVGRWMDKERQASFSRQCTELLLQFPIPPQKLQRDASRFQNDPTKALGINRINKCFKELNISYHLCSVQRGTEHKSQWILRTK